MRHLGKTPPFRGPHGEVVSGSIAEIAYRRLGGLAQWVMIRGESVANPPLILLHGGPGLSETGFFRHFNEPLEKSFTVVYWDQRGAGKSFDRNIPRSSMTVEQFISDLGELVDAVCKRLGKTKVAIFGHSWGSALGVLYAGLFPEKVAAYVGSGQIGDWAAGESASYAFALAEAQCLGKHRAVKKLRAIGPPPHTAETLWTQRMWLSRLEGRLAPRAMWKLGRAVLAGQESSIFDLPKTMRGFRFSLGATWTEVSRLNLIERVPALQMPVFFFLGRKDHWVPSEISLAYIDALTAPSKKLVWFEQSGHEPFVDEPAKFNAAMAELVRPVLSSAGRHAPRDSRWPESAHGDRPVTTIARLVEEARGSHRRWAVAAVVVAALAGAAAPPTAAAQALPAPNVPSFGQFRSVLAQGEGQSINGAELAQYLATGQPPDSFVNQQALYVDIMPHASSLTPGDLHTYYKDTNFGSMPGGTASVETPRPGVRIYGDGAYDMAHIYGDTRYDVMFGAGYASAEERLFLMDAIRRTAKGTLAGLLGPSAASDDAAQLTDQDFSDQELTQQFNRLDQRFGGAGEKTQDDILAYVDGINARISEDKADPSKMPAEYAALGATPRKWTVSDTAAMAVLLGRSSPSPTAARR